MKTLIRGIQALIHSESGQATAEYILLLATVSLISTTIIKEILRSIDLGILGLGASLERYLKTGRAPASVWSN